MKILRFFLVLFALGFFFLKAGDVFSQNSLERKIVVFKKDIPQEERLDLLFQHQAVFNKDLRLVDGIAVNIPKGMAEKLLGDSRVLRVDPDVEIFALDYPRFKNESYGLKRRWPRPTPTPKPTSTPTLIPTPSPIPTYYPTPTPTLVPDTQIIPWGVARIHTNEAWIISLGSGVRVAVIDTGIDRDHPDLKNNIAGCLNFIYPWLTCEDDNGHGTHVSGIIAAENNSSGVVGVAPNAKIYALKVLNSQGSGYLSDVIEALDWTRSNGVQLINMSLGTSSDVASFHDAIQRVNAAGVTQVAAAGNSGPGDNTVLYPAAYSEVIAVSATDTNNSVPDWSSRGPQIDLAAPGASVYSTYKNNSYQTLSGTSMAAPHVAGAVALRLFLHPTENPSAVEAILENNADSLPLGSNLVGAGLVNAYKVVAAP